MATRYTKNELEVRLLEAQDALRRVHNALIQAGARVGFRLEANAAEGNEHAIMLHIEGIAARMAHVVQADRENCRKSQAKRDEAVNRNRALGDKFREVSDALKAEKERADAAEARALESGERAERYISRDRSARKALANIMTMTNRLGHEGDLEYDAPAAVGKAFYDFARLALERGRTRE